MCKFIICIFLFRFCWYMAFPQHIHHVWFELFYSNMVKIIFYVIALTWFSPLCRIVKFWFSGDQIRILYYLILEQILILYFWNKYGRYYLVSYMHNGLFWNMAVDYFFLL
jgi:hypothetical protein